MRTSIIWCWAAAGVCLAAAACGEEVITGQKFGEFAASPAAYLEMPVILEDTFEGMVLDFSRIETQNGYSPAMYVKFRLGQCPYPCIGMNAPSLVKSLGQCAAGDLVSVTGNLQRIQEKRLQEIVQGSYGGGPSWEEHVYSSGPLKSEYFFNVGSVKKGWGANDSPAEMLKEGANLWDKDYREVPVAELNVEAGALVERSLLIRGSYAGTDDRFSEIEKAAGLTPETVLKFKVAGMAMECYLPKADSTVAAFRAIPEGNGIQVYGRIRKKETPKGIVAGFFVDRMTKTAAQGITPAEAGTGTPAGAAADAALAPPLAR